MKFSPTRLREGELVLRNEIRTFLAEELPADHEPGLGLAAKHDPEFSKKLAARGWVGMAIPAEYGGSGRSAVDRFVVTEELLAVGAPIGAHFVADRQTAPTLLSFGTEEQRKFFLPRIAAGECWFSLGMSEPDSGSDLASVRSTATRGEGGWSINGTKIWTSGAHLNHYFAVLCRTSPRDPQNRHAGISQLIVDLSSSGVDIRPIPYVNGEHSFNEVVLSDVFVPDEMVLGEIGSGWHQVTSELAYERSGPDRFMSTYPILSAVIEELDALGRDDEIIRAVGALAAQFWSIRQLSLSVARAIDSGMAPAVEAGLVKDLGTRFEQQSVELLRKVVDREFDPASSSKVDRLLAEAVLTSPIFTLRGGSTEILRSIAAKGLTS